MEMLRNIVIGAQISQEEFEDCRYSMAQLFQFENCIKTFGGKAKDVNETSKDLLHVYENYTIMLRQKLQLINEVKGLQKQLQQEMSRLDGFMQKLIFAIGQKQYQLCYYWQQVVKWQISQITFQVMVMELDFQEEVRGQ